MSFFPQVSFRQNNNQNEVKIQLENISPWTLYVFHLSFHYFFIILTFTIFKWIDLLNDLINQYDEFLKHKSTIIKQLRIEEHEFMLRKVVSIIDEKFLFHFHFHFHFHFLSNVFAILSFLLQLNFQHLSFIFHGIRRQHL